MASLLVSVELLEFILSSTGDYIQFFFCESKYCIAIKLCLVLFFFFFKFFFEFS